MKAKVSYLDGSSVELEGTPEEIRLFVFPFGNLPYVNNPGVTVQPYTIPTIWTAPYTACQHEYESPWNGLNPPPCKKCGVVVPRCDTWTATTFSEATNQ